MTIERKGLGDGIREVKLTSGEIRFEARINRSGEKALQKRFAKKADALRWRASTMDKVETNVPLNIVKKVFVRDAIDAYLQHRDKTDPMASNQRTEFIKVKNDFPDLLVKRLTRKEIEDWLRVLRTHSMGKYKSGIVKGPYKEASVRRFFFSLKRAIDWHKHARGYHVPDDLFKLEKAMKPKAWNGHRERRLRDGEEEALYAAGLTRKLSHSRADWEALIGFALETAMREQEIVFAQFEHVQKGGFDLKIPSENSKTDTRRIVHLSVKAQSIIAAQKLTCPPGETRIFHQFPSPKAVCVAFIALCARAKVVDFHFHDLRHEATSRLSEGNKLTLTRIMKMTGHTSLNTFLGYVQLNETTLANQL